MRITWIFALALALVTGSHALAQGPAPDCSGPQQNMNACAAKSLAAEDAALNRRYREALAAQYDEHGKRLLRKAQRAWLAFRDSQCALVADEARGGTLATLLDLSCREQMTRQRVVELGIASGERGGGLEAGVMLARIRQLLPKALRTSVFWMPEGVLNADFDQSGAGDLAAIGMRPADVRGEGGVVYAVMLPAGAAEPLWVEIPIGGEGFCAPPIQVRLEFLDGGGAVIAVDDGACDAFRIGLAGDPPQMTVQRN